jgi:hypothetical protein
MRILYNGCAIVLFVFLACNYGRPSVELWQEAWNEIQAAVPDPGVIEVEESRKRCNKLLVATREFRGRLLPSPDAALDDSIEQWLELAGKIGFDCSPARGQVDTYRDDLRELAILAAEIDAGLATAKGLEHEPPVAR